MNKQDLLDAVASRTKNTDEMLNGVLATITEEVSAERAVQLVGFGSFGRGERAARTGRSQPANRRGRRDRCREGEGLQGNAS